MLKKLFANRPTKKTVPVHLLSKTDAQKWLKEQSGAVQSWVRSTGAVRAGTVRLLPNEDGSLGSVLFIRETDFDVWAAARLRRGLPEGRYELIDVNPTDGEAIALGWALEAYVFDKYKKRSVKKSELVWPAGVDKKRVLRLAEATYLVRDLITTPAEDMGPAEIAATAKKLGERFGAKVSTIVGKDLLKKRFPSVHAVGRAAEKKPRLVDLQWGNKKHPKITLVGKGVTFDSGGLDLKPASSMLKMKKDMGGAAHVLGLALAIMDAKLPVNLRVLVPTVENAIGGNAFRPLDVLQTRKGITVEVGNTDAEGRLILSDALTAATEDSPELIIDFATLTGAARVALGTELPALFCNNDEVAAGVLEAGKGATDELWRMPLHQPYRRHLESRVADISNTSSTRYGGAITAALFLQRFVGHEIPWVHIDVMAYNDGSRVGRPAGGEAMGMRACFAYLETRYGRTKG